MKCINCGIHIPKNRRKYCSVRCIKEGWKRRNPEKVKQDKLNFRFKNPYYFKNYYIKNKERLSELDKEYYKKNREKILKRSSEYKRKKRQLKVANGEINLDKHMLGSSAVQKGKLLENFIVDQLRLSGVDIHARRTKGSGGYLEKGDIYNKLNLNIECKNQKTFQFRKFWTQTLKDSEKTHSTPILIWHPPNLPLEDSAVMMPLDYFCNLLKRAEEPKIKEPDREFKWQVQRLVDAARAVIKQIE